ncbi:nuclear transport factor 2 family protein [Draconibacterium sp.]|nr:nuclear transport factor 2 family protein [Draconibacterium sp.]
MKNEVIDFKAEEEVVKNLLNTLMAAWDRQDVATMTSLLSENALFRGNGPSEVYNKKQVSEGWSQMLAQPFPLDVTEEPVIRVSPDGNSAHATQQYFMPLFSTKIQFRNGYFLNKVDGKWLIYTCNTACLLNDDDFPKINEALSE